MINKVLVVATSRKTRGGITSVVRAHEGGEQWNRYHCRWVETHRDGNALVKIYYLLKGFLSYICLLPFYSIVHFHLSEPISAIRKCLFLPLAKCFGKKIIIHFHAFSPETTIGGKYHKVYGYLFKRADKVVVLSNYWKSAVNEAFHLADKVYVIYNPCTSEVLTSEYEKKKQFLYAGTVNARKGYADMIKAFALIAPEFPDWKVVFAGNGEIDKGKELAKELNISAQTEFLGWVNGEAKDRAFKESEIFCLPSYAEGFPMAVLDAWAYGLPVITTPVGGIPDIAEDKENMLLFVPGDIQRLATQMKLMIEDNILRDRIAENSLLLSRTTFNIDTINRQIGALYESFS